MTYTIPRQMQTARTITRNAEQQIRKKTGIRIHLLLNPEYNPARSPEQMLLVVARALGMDTACYTLRSRARDVVELRFIASRLLRTYFPGITLQRISIYFGGQDHTSVINGLARAGMLLETKDTSFTNKFETAQQHVNQWLEKETSGSGSLISA